jgi:hypothetical protein
VVAVSVGSTGAGTPQSGYVACQWLAESAPRIAALDKERLERERAGAERRELLPLEERAFWLSPSLERWTSLARDQQILGLRDGVVPADAPPGSPRLAPSESFADSLAVLGAGSLVVRDLVESSPVAANDAAIVKVLQASPLPDARPSWFKPGDVDAVIPSGVPERDVNAGTAQDDSVILWHSALAPLDALSYRAKARMSVKVVEAWHPGHDGTLLGLGGAGALSVKYEPAAQINVVEPGGKMTSIPVGEIRYRLAVEGCEWESASLLDPRRLPSVRDVRDASVSWVGTRPARKQALIASNSSELRVGDERYKLVATRIDVDADGQPDFLVHEWTDETAKGGRIVHANLGGAWRMMFATQVGPCGD